MALAPSIVNKFVATVIKTHLMNSYAVLHASDRTLFGSIYTRTPAIAAMAGPRVSATLNNHQADELDFDEQRDQVDDDVNRVLSQIRDALDFGDQLAEEEDNVNGVLRMVETALEDDTEQFGLYTPCRPQFQQDFALPPHFYCESPRIPMTARATVASTNYQQHDTVTSPIMATAESITHEDAVLNDDFSNNVLGPEFMAFNTGTVSDSYAASNYTCGNISDSLSAIRMVNSRHADDDCGESETIMRIAQKYLPANLKVSEVGPADMYDQASAPSEEYSMATINYLQRHKLTRE